MKFINHKTGYVLYTPLGLLNGQWVQFDGLFHSKNLSMTGEWVVGGGGGGFWTWDFQLIY